MTAPWRPEAAADGRFTVKHTFRRTRSHRQIRAVSANRAVRVAHTAHFVRCHIVGTARRPLAGKAGLLLCVGCAGVWLRNVINVVPRGFSASVAGELQRTALLEAYGMVDARYIGSAWRGDGWWLACRHDGLCYAGCDRRVVPSGQVRRVARTLSVAVRAAGRPGARGHGHIADSVVIANITQSRLRRSDGM